jgi:hypothetical protein
MLELEADRVPMEGWLRTRMLERTAHQHERQVVVAGDAVVQKRLLRLHISTFHGGHHVGGQCP